MPTLAAMPNRDRDLYFHNRPHRVPLGFEQHGGDKQFATTLARGIELMRCFTAEDTALSNAELAARTGLPREHAPHSPHDLLFDPVGSASAPGNGKSVPAPRISNGFPGNGGSPAERCVVARCPAARGVRASPGETRGRRRA